MQNSETGADTFLTRPRSLLLLIAVSTLLGIAMALAIFPLQVVLGIGPFWDFPKGTVPGSAVDMAQELVGYLYLVQAPWSWPLLHVANLDPPGGTNAFWLDPVPWLGLVGKLVFGLTGHVVNLLGLYILASYALPGAAMTALLYLAGQRGLLVPVAATLIVNATPFLMFEWGHIALCGQFILIIALALYYRTTTAPPARWASAAWLVLLALTMLTHLYLFVMVGGIWFATIVQNALDNLSARRRLAVQAILTTGAILLLGIATGILSRDIRSGGTMGFGGFSMNLGSAFIPQLSGAIPPLREYWLGMRSQVYSYVGLGALLVLVAAAPGLPGWIGHGLRRHKVLIAILAGFYLFALSTKVTLGARVLVNIPLPDSIAYALGAFRASGRFFWPVGYALMALGIVTVLRRYRPLTAAAILLVAGVVQWIDAGPTRNAVAASVTNLAPPDPHRAAIRDLTAAASAAYVFPTPWCIEAKVKGTPDPIAAEAAVLRMNAEIQLATAARNLPTNSVINSRIATDCAAEEKLLQAPLRPGAVYFYLTPVTLQPGQLSGRRVEDVCTSLGPIQACKIPAAGK